MTTDNSKEGYIGFLKNTTIDGLIHVYKPPTVFSRIFWFFIFIVGVAGFSCSLAFIVKQYLSSYIRVRHYVDKESFTWPDLTFCNPTAPYDLETNIDAGNHWTETLKKSNAIIKNLAGHKLFNESEDFYVNNTDLAEKAVMLSSINLHKIKAANHKRYVQFIGYSQYHPETYLVKKYGHYPTHKGPNDSSKLFTTKFVTIQNNIPCFTFQIENSKSIKFNETQSLVFKMILNLKSYQIFNDGYMPRSVFLYITDKDQLPQDVNIIISPGFKYEFTITQARYTRQGYKNPCRNELYKIDLYDTLLQSTYKYEGSYDDCRNVIRQEMYVTKCKCYSPFLPIYKSNNATPKLCFNTSAFDNENITKNADCMFKVYTEYTNNHTLKDIANKKCQKYKPRKCDDVVYNSQFRKDFGLKMDEKQVNERMNNYFNGAYAINLKEKDKNGDNVKETKEDIAILSIRRNSKLGDLFSEDLEYSRSDFVSDIGGLMGLWLGMSVVGICEICEITYILLSRLIGFLSSVRCERPNVFKKPLSY